VLWVCWLAALGLGATAGAQLPDWLRLEFLIPLFLIGEIVPKLRQVATRRAALAAAAVAVACLSVPMHLGIAIGIVAGIAAGARTRPQAAKQEAVSTQEGHR
jgi:predicted branched-subunit amino acid permease